MLTYINRLPAFLLFIVLVIGCANEHGPTEPTIDGPFINSLGRQLPADAAPLHEQVLMYFIEEPKTLDVSLDNYGVKGSDPHLFERLTMFDANDVLRPGVADRWESSEDGLIWTFYLRKGAKWSDGRPLTAHDFEYTFKRFLDPNEGNVFAFLFYNIKNAREFNHGKLTEPDSVGVRAIGDLMLEVEVKAPCPYLPFIMAYNSAAPVPPWQVKKYGRRWTEPENMVSNYSYKLEEWITDRYMSFDLNQHYNGAYPGYLEKIKLKFIVEGTHPGIMPYANKEVDRQTVFAQFLGEINKDPILNQELISNPHFQTWYLFFQTKSAPFNDVRVRRAVSHAIDREVICKFILQGHGTPAYTMLPPNFPGYTGEKLKNIQRFDISEARRLLSAAGYPGGKGFPIMEFWLRQADPNQMSIAEAIQEMLRENLGLRVEIRNQEIGNYMNNMYEYSIPFGFIPYQYDYPDPENMLSQVWHSQPVGHGRHDWRNDAFDRLVEAGGTTLGNDKRMQFYAEAEQILVEDVGGVFVYHANVLELRKPWFKGLKPNDWGQDLFWGNRTNLMDVYIGNNVEKRVF